MRLQDAPMQDAPMQERASLRCRRIGIEPVGPYRIRLPVFVDPEDLCFLALLAELMRGIDREQHRLAFALIGPELVSLEVDQPKVLPTIDEVAPACSAGDKDCKRVSSSQQRSQ